LLVSKILIQMAKLDIQWLEVFIEIYRTNSVTRAADRLGMPQPNASMALSNLRRYYGDRLFSRTSNGMEPTPFAQAVFPDIEDAVSRLAGASGNRAPFEAATAVRSFRISMTDISEIVILPQLINHLEKQAPGVQIEAERSSADTPRRLESGEVDLAIGFLPQLESGFYQQVLFKQDFVVIAAQNHPRIRGSLSRQAFLRERHISITTSGTGHAIVGKVLERQKTSPHIALKVPSFLSVARLVSSTDLLVVVPRKLGEALAAGEAIQVLKVPVALPTYSVKQHWHERFHGDAGNAWLRSVVAQLLRPV